MLLMSSAYAQKTVSGVVTDEGGLGIPGVTVIQKGSSNGTVTDVDGNFSVSVPEDAVLQFSFMGMLPQELSVSGKTGINVTLAEAVKGLDEVVVVGYGTQKKKNMTDAVATVSIEKEIGERPVATVNQMLQGSIANFNVSTTNSGGEPGASTNLNIRGAGTLTGDGGTPYILLDGVPISVSQMNSINPYDIENISVLKDAASAAIYGSRGAYGVILITSKKGKAGKVSVNYSGNIAFASPTSLPNMVNSLDFANAYNTASINDGALPIFGEENGEMQRIRDYIAGKITDDTQPTASGGSWMYWEDGYANYDWYDVMFKDNAPRQQHQISVNGGAEKTNYYLSGSYYDQEGNLEYADNNYDRYNFTASINTEATDWLRFDASSKYSREHKLFPSGGYGTYTKDIIYHQVSRLWPVCPLYDPDGNFVNYDVNRVMDSGNANEYTNNTTVQGGVEVEPIKNWVTRMSYNYQLTNENSERILLENNILLPNGSYKNVGYNPNGVERAFSENLNQLFNITTKYRRSFGNHNLDALLGYEQRSVEFSGLEGSKSKFATENVPSISTAVGDDIAYDALSHYATRGWFGSLNYNYNEKYLFSFKLRADESSFFREGRRLGVFPSVSAGYLISEENFWSPIKHTLNILKLRGSWGQLGNHDPDLANKYIELMNISNGQYLINGERPSVATLGSLVSPSLTWETVTSMDFGLDAALFSNRLDFTFDWFSRVTSDMIGPVAALPSILGASAPAENNAELTTKGWELSMGWKDQIGEVTYRVGFNIGDNKTQVTKYNNPTQTFDTYREGQILGDIWGYETVGYFKDGETAADWHDQSYINANWGAGDIKYADLNGDKKINTGNNTELDPGDRKIIGNNRARYNYGINLGAGWKGIDLSILLQGVAKRDYIFGSGTNLFWGFAGNMWQSTITDASIDYWTEDNPNAYFPKPYLKGEHTKNTQSQTKYLQNAAYLRLKNIQLSYTFTNEFVKKIGLSRAQIYFSGENLLTFTKLHKNFDPEALGGGWGGGKIYPLQRILSFGINLGL